MCQTSTSNTKSLIEIEPLQIISDAEGDRAPDFSTSRSQNFSTSSPVRRRGNATVPAAGSYHSKTSQWRAKNARAAPTLASISSRLAATSRSRARSPISARICTTGWRYSNGRARLALDYLGRKQEARTAPHQIPERQSLAESETSALRAPLQVISTM